MKYQIVYRTEDGTAEIHAESCREWERGENAEDETLVDAPNTWSAAMAAWEHDNEPEICATNYTLFFPCLAPEAKRRPRRSDVPFDPEGTPAEILEACYGKVIRWRNDISGKVDMARLYPAGPHNSKRRGIITEPHKFTKITYGPDGAAILNFISLDGGFRAVRLDSIVKVGAR